MKKLFLGIAMLTTFIVNCQTSDSTNTALKINSFKVIVISPIEDPGVQNRPKCKTQVDYTPDGCCHTYNVYCDGSLAWSGSTFCDFLCLFVGSRQGHFESFNPNENNPPTVDNQKQLKLKFDFSVTEGRIPLPDPNDEILYLKQIQKEIMFENPTDQFIKMGNETVIYKKGFYVIRNGKMDVTYYVQ